VRQLGAALLVESPGTVMCTAGFDALVAAAVVDAAVVGQLPERVPAPV